MMFIHAECPRSPAIRCSRHANVHFAARRDCFIFCRRRHVIRRPPLTCPGLPFMMPSSFDADAADMPIFFSIYIRRFNRNSAHAFISSSSVIICHVLRFITSFFFFSHASSAPRSAGGRQAKRNTAGSSRRRPFIARLPPTPSFASRRSRKYVSTVEHNRMIFMEHPTRTITLKERLHVQRIRRW